MFEIKSVILKDKKTGKNKIRYYAEVYLSPGRKMPLILSGHPQNYWKQIP